MKKSLILLGTFAGCVFLVKEVMAFLPNGYSAKCPCETPLCGAVAVPIEPYVTTDSVRSITGLIAGIISLTGDGESKAQLIATQEEDNQKACGAGGSAATTNTTTEQLNPGSVAGSEFSGSAFDYVNAEILANEGNVGYSPLKTALASAKNNETVRANIRTAVKTEFFADPTKSEQKTTEYKNKIRAQRNKYTQEAAGRHISLGYRVKGYIQNDLESISSAAVSGDGELGSIAVDAHTLEQMVKMALVDLALQIEMMEADAIHFLSGQPIELMNEAKPTSAERK